MVLCQFGLKHLHRHINNRLKLKDFSRNVFEYKKENFSGVSDFRESDNTQVKNNIHVQYIIFYALPII